MKTLILAALLALGIGVGVTHVATYSGGAVPTYQSTSADWSNG